MSPTNTFDLFHSKIQKWIWEQNWTCLREIQELSAPIVLSQSCDVIICAPTAAGKTEAAFLPALSKLADNPPTGLGILYISPLKALINDLFRRLEPLGQCAGFPVTPWHGDVPIALKNKFNKRPIGVMLITPESLESMFLNRGPWIKKNFANLQYVIIDEFHAFLGSERGIQLQSLLRRLEFLLQKNIPRLALSATLGDVKQIVRALRPQSNFPYKIVESSASGLEIKLQLRGYERFFNPKTPVAFDRITDDLFKILRGDSHLVFANSRKNAESYALALSDKCQKAMVPNEFFPHHGNLSRELRENLEKRLQKESTPTVAVCTMTLELGIDIGHVNSVAQIGPPQSVASLRQRLGRSGRRGEAAILRFFITEESLQPLSALGDRLRLASFQCLAMVNLLLNKWCESADNDRYSFSTLVQQTLSTVGQYGGVRANQLWSLLCRTGPFNLVTQEQYALILRALGAKHLLTQTPDGQLVLGNVGEILTSQYTFFSSFNAPEEYSLESNGQPIGSLPILIPLSIGQLIIFAGKRWEILEIDANNKRISLKPGAGGQPPTFSGVGQMLDQKIRQEMFQVYLKAERPKYINDTAKEFFDQGIDTFRSLDLKNKSIVLLDSCLYLTPWLGDKTINALSAMLRSADLKVEVSNNLILVENCHQKMLLKVINSILNQPKPKADQLAANIPDTLTEKFDQYVPEPLRWLDYGLKYFDVDGAWRWLKDLSEKS
ncbi:MAG: DEAD/DEAH box helicase [Deltaproteobacteria bacterium]|jgi:ATP-dependent Lhr-like helicase|nr:DEAD/DEAH box helicase [Deltaproteobacteria bacterium]